MDKNTNNSNSDGDRRDEVMELNTNLPATSTIFGTPYRSTSITAQSPFLSPYFANLQLRRTPDFQSKKRKKKSKKKKKKSKKGKKYNELRALQDDDHYEDDDEDLSILSVTSIGSTIGKRKEEEPPKTTPVTKRQWSIFVLYCLGFFSLGLFTSAPGPLLTNFEAQVNVSLSTISFIFSARAIGFVIGSICSGYILDNYQSFILRKIKLNEIIIDLDTFNVDQFMQDLPKLSFPPSPHNFFSVSLIIPAICMVWIPFVTSVYVLCVLVSVNGICFGMINTFGNVCLLTLFDTNDIDRNNDNTNDNGNYGSIDVASDEEEEKEDRVGPFMQGLQAFYAFGGFVAPLLIQLSFSFFGVYDYAFFALAVFYTPVGIALFFYPSPIRMSVLSLALAQHREQLETQKDTNEKPLHDKQEKEIKIQQKLSSNKMEFYSILIVIGFATFLCWYVGGQVGYGMYITTYCIDYLNLSDATGRYLASANWFGLAIGRLIAVPLSRKLSALNMCVMDLIGCQIGCLILYLSPYNHVFVWISSFLVGLSMASVWPSMFVWAESLITVSGTFASIMVFGGSLGEFLIPALVGNLMSFFGSQTFSDAMNIISVLLIIQFVANWWAAKKLRTLKRSKSKLRL